MEGVTAEGLSKYVVAACFIGITSLGISDRTLVGLVRRLSLERMRMLFI